MANGKAGRPRGRGYKIDKQQFEKLARIMCSVEEIADWFDVSMDTLAAWTKQEYDDTPLHVIGKLCNKGRKTLREIQFAWAEKNPTMAIWLGKQYLGQTDKLESQNVNKVEFIDDMPEDEEENEL